MMLKKKGKDASSSASPISFTHDVHKAHNSLKILTSHPPRFLHVRSNHTHTQCVRQARQREHSRQGVCQLRQDSRRAADGRRGYRAHAALEQRLPSH